MSAADQSQEREPGYTVHAKPRRRGFETARDMVYSLSAVGACIAVILVITHRPSRDPVRVVQLGEAVAAAKSEVSWQVHSPEGRGRLHGWRATSARFERANGGTLSIGWVTPDSQWVGMVQVGIPFGTSRARAWEAKLLRDAKSTGPTLSGGNEQMTYLIHGTATMTQMNKVAAAAGFEP